MKSECITYKKENKIQTLQKEFIEKLKGMTVQDAKFVLEPVLKYVESSSIIH